MTFRPHLATRHRPSQLNSYFQGDGLDFAQYIERSREMIARARIEADAASVEGNTPFELFPAAPPAQEAAKPYRRGILLTHGLSDSPYYMRHLAAIFQADGFRVMAPLLPGHGTRPGDLLEIGWHEWAKAVAYGVEQLVTEVDELYLGGYSAGAALSLFHAAQDSRVRGLFLFSPALAISPLARWAGLHKLYSWAWPEARWLDIMPDRDRYKYESFPYNAAAQAHALIAALGAPGHVAKLPIFAAASREDATVRCDATLDFMAHMQHPCSRLVLYAAGEVSLPPGLAADRVEVVDSRIPGQNILGSAHTAIVLPPNDPYYGEAGSYVNCQHYYPHDMSRYAACSDPGKNAWQGEVSRENLARGLLRRLMYNPHFAGLERSLQQFIASLP